MRRTFTLNADGVAGATLLLAFAITIVEVEVLVGSADVVVASLGTRVLQANAVDPDAITSIAMFGDATNGQNGRSHLSALKISLKPGEVLYLQNATNAEVCRANIVADLS